MLRCCLFFPLTQSAFFFSFYPVSLGVIVREELADSSYLHPYPPLFDCRDVLLYRSHPSHRVWFPPEKRRIAFPRAPLAPCFSLIVSSDSSALYFSLERGSRNRPARVPLFEDYRQMRSVTFFLFESFLLPGWSSPGPPLWWD